MRDRTPVPAADDRPGCAIMAVIVLAIFAMVGTAVFVASEVWRRIVH